MAYSTKYTITYDSAARTRCVVQLQQEDYSGPVTELTPAKEPSRIRWGRQRQTDELMGQPILPVDARIRFKGDADGQTARTDLFDIGTTEWRVRFMEGTSGSETLVWQGYVLDDLIRDNPFSESEDIEIVAADGFKMLENKQQVNQLTDTYAYNFANLLQPLHNLPIVTSMQWAPDEASIPAGETALNHLYVPYGGYRELDERGDEREQLNQREQLDDMLRRFGLVLFQYGGEWHVHQRDAINTTTGEIQQWTMPAGEYEAAGVTLFNSAAETVNLNVGDLMDEGNGTPYVLKTERPGAGIQRLRSVTSVHRFADLGSVFANAGFESGLTHWTTGGNGTVSVDNYDNTAATRNSTQENLNVCVLSPGDTTESRSSSTPGPVLSQDSFLRLSDATRGVLWMDWQMGQSDPNRGGATRVRITTDSHSLEVGKMSIDGFTEAAVDEPGIINVTAEYPGVDPEVLLIPKGTDIRVMQDVADNGNGESGVSEIVTITVEEDVYTGDTSIRATFDKDIPADTYITYYRWTSADVEINERFLPRFMLGANVMNDMQLAVPLHTPTGVSVSGNLGIEIRAPYGDYGRDWSNPDDVTDVSNTDVYVDNVNATIKINGEDVSETRITILDPEVEDGRHQEIVHRMGDGPIVDHPRAIDYDLFTGTPITETWKDASDQTGRVLERFTAENLMRQQRRSLRRYNFRLTVREGQELTPYSVYEVDGDLFTVGMMERRWASHANNARVQLDELKDFGTAGLQQGFSMGSSSSTGSGGSSSPTFVDSQNVSGATSWSELSGRPGGLYAANAATDGITETIPLTSAAITGALGYTPYQEGTDLTARAITLENLEFSTAPQVNGTLLYDQSTGLAVRYDAGTLTPNTYTGYSTLLDSVNTITGPNLDLTGGTVADARPTLSILQGPGSGLDADTLDGSHASSFLRSDVETTITAPWTFTKHLTFTAAQDQLRFDNTGDTVYWQNKPSENVEFGVYNVTKGTWSVRVKDTAEIDLLGDVQVDGNVEIDNGISTSLTIRSNDAGESVIMAHGNNQGTGRVFVGQSSGFGGGIEYNGDGTPTSTGAGSDYVTLYRRDAGEDEWTARNKYSNNTWEFRGDVLFNEQVISPGAATGFTGSGTIIDATESWFENVQIRGRLTARELEIRKITQSKGPHMFGVGGGKVDSVSGSGVVREITFVEDHGFDSSWGDANTGGSPEADFVIVQEYAAGSGNVIRKLEGRVQDVIDSKTALINWDYGANTDVPKEGDDIVQVASYNNNRDGMIFVDPFGPHIDVLDGISTLSDWDSRSPTVRLGDISGAPVLADGTQPSGHGLYATNIFLEGTVVADNGKIGNWTINDDALYGTDQSIHMALALSDDSGLPWGTPVRGLQIGTDINNRMWFGKVGSDYDMRVRVDGDDLVQLGSSTNQIAGWSITSRRMVRAFAAGQDVYVGQWSDKTGIRARGTGGFVRLNLWNNDPEFLAYADNSNFVSIGSGFQRSVMGMTVKAAGKIVFETSTTGAVFGNVTITDELKMGDGGIIRNGDDDFRITDDGINLIGDGSVYGSPSQITFTKESGAEAGSLYYDGEFGGDNLHLETPGGITIRSLNDGSIKLLSDEKVVLGQRQNEVPAFTVDRPNETITNDCTYNIYRNMATDQLSDSEVRSRLSKGECMLYPIEFSNGNINLCFAAHREDGSVEQSFMST